MPISKPRAAIFTTGTKAAGLFLSLFQGVMGMVVNVESHIPSILLTVTHIVAKPLFENASANVLQSQN